MISCDKVNISHLGRFIYLSIAYYKKVFRLSQSANGNRTKICVCCISSYSHFFIQKSWWMKTYGWLYHLHSRSLYSFTHMPMFYSLFIHVMCFSDYLENFENLKTFFVSPPKINGGLTQRQIATFFYDYHPLKRSSRQISRVCLQSPILSEF